MKFIIFIYVGLTLSTMVLADTSNEVRRLKKCYGIFVREPIAANHPLLTQVKSGTKTGTAACMEVFDMGALQADNQVKKDGSGKHLPEALKVLRSIQDFHMTYLEVPQFEVDEEEGYTPDILDIYEHTYHLTYVALKPAQRYDRIVRGNNSFNALRTGKLRSTHIAGENNITFKFAYTLTQAGVLHGIEPLGHQNIAEYGRGYVPNFYTTVTDPNMNAHHGAGMIGSQGYIKANADPAKLNNFEGINGANHLYRRWGKHVVEDLLCRDLPSLRPGDVTGDVYPSSTISFRRGVSCMQCHATMDTAANTIRNIRAQRLYGVHFTWSLPVNRPSLEGAATINPDPLFGLRPPEGALRYRSYDGSLVNQSVTGINALGNAIAQSNDFYVCAAKKYYKYLTGITANLSDPGALGAPVLTPGEKLHRDKVIQLGLELKTEQEIRKLIQKIIASPTFINSGSGV
jgi:hypothetical protein